MPPRTTLLKHGQSMREWDRHLLPAIAVGDLICVLVLSLLTLPNPCSSTESDEEGLFYSQVHALPEQGYNHHFNRPHSSFH